jgi:hypothetical protein
MACRTAPPVPDKVGQLGVIGGAVHTRALVRESECGSSVADSEAPCRCCGHRPHRRCLGGRLRASGAIPRSGSARRRSASRTRCRRTPFWVARCKFGSSGHGSHRYQVDSLGRWSREGLRRSSKRADLPSGAEEGLASQSLAWDVTVVPNRPTVPATLWKHELFFAVAANIMVTAQRHTLNALHE